MGDRPQDSVDAAGSVATRDGAQAVYGSAMEESAPRRTSSEGRQAQRPAASGCEQQD